jgi:putative toxin-antitoxin system antitoxin component (TIGR02293 family)
MQAAGKQDTKKKAPAKKAGKVIPLPKDIIRHVDEWNAFEKMDYIKAGISKLQFEEIKKQTGLDYETLSRILTVTKATLHNKKGDARFSATVSERILMLADIYAFGYDVFEDKGKFNAWIATPLHALNGKTPISIMDTVYGMEEVRNLIGRIAYGVYS